MAEAFELLLLPEISQAMLNSASAMRKASLAASLLATLSDEPKYLR